MKIKSTHPESQGPFVVIDDDDFDPATMKEYSDAAEPAPSKPKHKPTAED